MEIDLHALRDWIGRTQTQEEDLTPAVAERFNATFGRESPLAIGAEAPLLIHLCLCQPAAASETLGPDGHPARGSFLPPVPLPRRMWAGGAFEFHSSPRIGDKLTRRSTIQNVQLKKGSSGQLVFVTVDHRVASDGQPVLTERQEIVYRELHPRSDASPRSERPAPHAPKGEAIREVHPDPVLLFRYSALTFNGHRIHYDRRYVTEEEGYPGLVVHGPLQATMLAQFAADLRGAPPARFSFRSLSPIFDTMTFTLNASRSGTGLALWTAAEDGPVAMEASAEW